VLVLKRLVPVLVIVRLGEVQIDADPHEQCRADRGNVGGSPNGGACSGPLRGRRGSAGIRQPATV